MTVIFCVHVVLFFSIFVHGFDLDFSEFRSIPGNDFLGIGSLLVELHLSQVWERILLLWSSSVDSWGYTLGLIGYAFRI